jgi:predicted HicB family RNase H-like nuclease
MLQKPYIRRGPKMKGRSKSAGLNISMTPELRERIVAEAERTEKSLAETIRTVLEAWFR